MLVHAYTTSGWEVGVGGDVGVQALGSGDLHSKYRERERGG